MLVGGVCGAAVEGQPALLLPVMALELRIYMKLVVKAFTRRGYSE